MLALFVSYVDKLLGEVVELPVDLLKVLCHLRAKLRNLILNGFAKLCDLVLDRLPDRAGVMKPLVDLLLKTFEPLLKNADAIFQFANITSNAID